MGSRGMQMVSAKWQAGKILAWSLWGIGAMALSGCATSPEDQAMLSQVVTALPQEVEGCTFVGNVDNEHVHYTMQGARDNLRLQVARLGANTVVETHLLVTPDFTVIYPYSWFSSAPLSTMSSPTFFISGRAYICGENQGPKRLPQVQEGAHGLFKATPQPLATAPQAPTTSAPTEPVPVSSGLDTSTDTD